MSSTMQRILMVDDDPHVLSGYRRTLGRKFDITCAEGGESGLRAIELGEPFAVIITDMRMPRMSGTEFITAAREKTRDAVFLMLTGNGDQQTAVDAINTGHIFRFLTKPCSHETVEAALLAAVRQHEMVTAERVLLRDTLTGSIRLMVDALELADPHLGAAQSIVKQVVFELCSHFKIPYDWQFMVAGSVSLIGLVGIHRARHHAVPSERALAGAAALGSQLVMNIPRMGSVSTILSRQRERGPLPSDLTNHSRENIETIAACFIRAGVDLAFAYRAGLSHDAAIHSLAATGDFDPRIIDALNVVPSSLNPNEQEMWSTHEIKLSDIAVGMVLNHDLTRPDGTLLLSKGQPVSELAASHLRSLGITGAIANVVLVRVRAE